MPALKTVFFFFPPKKRLVRFVPLEGSETNRIMQIQACSQVAWFWWLAWFLWLAQCFLRTIARAWAILVIMGHENHATSAVVEMWLAQLELALLFSKIF